ncbi:hypothetical protein [Actinoplanes sp. NPDC051859]|uniref:hypothetical protein n=1 Tax=Actinoplanes sp. NPDC051859 TaxID=3363909 RepID=UPI0037A878C3
MSELTLQDLLSVQAAPWQAAADTWKRLADSIDHTDEQLFRSTRDLPEAWPSGAGSQAAVAKAGTLCTRVSSAHGPVKSIGDQLQLHGYAMEALRHQAEQIIASARQAGYTVDTAAGTITAPASAYTGGNLDRTGRETGALLNDLRTLVERARAQDDQTAGILKAATPSAQNSAGARPAGAISRAEELAQKLKDPNYQPTAAELDELRDLVTLYGKNKAFAFELLDMLGPQGLLQLNGTLATYQLDFVGKEEDGFLFDRDTADMVRDLQLGLGVMLDTATEPSGTRTGPRGDMYVPGQYELPSQWVADLMVAGRSKMDIGDPSSPRRYVEDVYGYQLLGPLLHHGDFDPKFISMVGGDMIDFEMQQGKNSALWTEMRSEDLRLDWTQGHDDNTTPAGYDPVNALMDGLSHNGAGTQDLLTNTRTFGGDSPEGGRLPRLDYLLTDRNWDPKADIPGGPAWTTELMQHGGDYKNGALENFGKALEHATTDHPGEDARRLVEAIVYETNVDEQAKGYANGERPPGEGEKGSKTTDFTKSDLIKPELRDSMGNIMAAYISDVNANLSPGQTVVSGQISVDQTHLTRFIADLGKDEGAHRSVATAEAIYAAGMYDHVLSGRQNPNDDLDANLRSMENISHNYGSVLGALDLGAAAAQHATSADLDEKYNKDIENRYKIIGPLVEGAVGAATAKVPGGSDLANGFVGDFMDDLEKNAKVDNQGQVNYDVGTMLGASRTTMVDLTEASLYYSGKLPDLPERFIPDGHLKPLTEWNERDIQEWQRYKAEQGQSTVENAATQAANSYKNGHEWARNLFYSQYGKAPE